MTAPVSALANARNRHWSLTGTDEHGNARFQVIKGDVSARISYAADVPYATFVNGTHGVVVGRDLQRLLTWVTSTGAAASVRCVVVERDGEERLARVPSCPDPDELISMVAA